MDAVKGFFARWLPIRGLIVGAVAISAIALGFNWVTFTGSATKMAADQSKAAVVAALTPVCIAKANADPQMAELIAEIKDASSYGSARTSKLLDFGWTKLPGVDKANDNVAQACVKALLAAQTS